MNRNKLIGIISVFIIVVGLVILLIPKSGKEGEVETESPREITEEDYKTNPKYILEEVIVSEGKHLKLPEVDAVWDYNYQAGECIVGGALELSEQAYNDIINQMDNELNIPRFEESEYKDKTRKTFTVSVNGYETEYEKFNQSISGGEADVVYIFEMSDCKYQTKGQGELLMGVFMCKKYGKYYMAFHNRYEFRWFYAQPGD